MMMTIRPGFGRWLRILLPPIVLVFGWILWGDVELRRTAIAIERYRQDHNTLPDALPQVAMPSDTSLDPFTGKPLQFHRLDTGYELYSVGRDEKDNGGDIGPDEKTVMPGNVAGTSGSRCRCRQSIRRRGDEALEQRTEFAGAVEVLGVPLHAEDEPLRWILDGFDDAVGSRGRGDQS
jgi:hypothetical protein